MTAIEIGTGAKRVCIQIVPCSRSPTVCLVRDRGFLRVTCMLYEGSLGSTEQRAFVKSPYIHHASLNMFIRHQFPFKLCHPLQLACPSMSACGFRARGNVRIWALSGSKMGPYPIVLFRS